MIFSCPTIRFLLIVFCLFSSFSTFAQYVSKGNKPGWVKQFAVDPNAKTGSSETGGYYYVLIDYQVSLPAQQRYRHYGFKILSSEGIQEMSDINISFDPKYQKLTIHEVNIHREGQLIQQLPSIRFKTLNQEDEADRYLYNETLTAVANLEDIRVGDVIEYSYTVTGFNPVYGGSFAFDRYMETDVPVAENEFRIQTLATTELSIQNKNDVGAPVIVKEGNNVSYSWTLRQVPADKSIGHTPSWHTDTKMISVATKASWGDVVNRNLPRFQLSEKDKTDLAKLAGSKFPTNDNRQYALDVIRFVQDDIRYLGFESGVNSFQPHHPAKVWQQRFGDCKDKSFLLVTLLNMRSIKAWPMLISTTDRQMLSDVLPSDNAFDHCVVRFEYDGHQYNIDPTISNQGGGLDSISFPNYAKGLVVRPGELDLTDLPLINVGKTVEYQVLELKTIGDSATMMVRTEYTGTFADDERTTFASGSIESMQESYQRFYHGLYPDIKASRKMSIVDDRKRNVLIVKEQYTIPHFWGPDELDSTRISCTLYPYSLDTYFSIDKSTQRKTPYALKYPVHYEHHLTVRLPKHWDIDKDKKNIDNPYYKYHYELSSKGDEVYMDTEYETKGDHIPVGYIKNFVKDHGLMMDNLSYYLLHSKNISGDVGADKTTDSGVYNSWAIYLTGLLSLLTAFICFRIYQGYDPEPVRADFGGQYLGGWLLLFAFGIIISPIRLFFDAYVRHVYFLNETFETLAAPANHWLWTFAALEFIYNAVMVPFSVLVAILFFQRRSSFPRVIVVYLMIAAFFNFMEIVHQLLSDLPSTKSIVTFGIGFVAAAGIWIPYFTRSERVKDTFVVRL